MHRMSCMTTEMAGTTLYSFVYLSNEKTTKGRDVLASQTIDSILALAHDYAPSF
jgi:hypothetical protein